MAMLWEEWLGSNEDWKKSKYAIRLSSTSEHWNIGCRRWMTLKQLISKYEDADVAKSIVEAKKSDPILKDSHCKPHPDCPQNPATRSQFFVSQGTVRY